MSMPLCSEMKRTQNTERNMTPFRKFMLATTTGNSHTPTNTHTIAHTHTHFYILSTMSHSYGWQAKIFETLHMHENTRVYSKGELRRGKDYVLWRITFVKSGTRMQ